MMGISIAEQRGKLARSACRLNARSRAGQVPSLILMTDDQVKADWASAVCALPARAAVIVRHRDARLRAALAMALRPICRLRRVALLVADDLGLALRCGADGLHVPESRSQLIARARRLRGGWLVTSSAHDLRAVLAASRHGADAVLVSPVFATRSHSGSVGLGAVRLASLVAQSDVPVIALGGISAATVSRFTGTGVSGVALIRGWLAT